MAQRIAGVAYVKVDGTQYPLRGNFTVSPSNVERQMLAGQDGVHGYYEIPRVPFIEGDISTVPGFSLETAQAIVDSTVTAELANGMTYTLNDATTTAAFSINTRDGLFHIRWEGVTCDEF
jgi:hypothetical protein